MQVAGQELIGGNQALIRAAPGVGDDSGAAFARAFRRVVKMSPAAFRRQGRQPATV